MIWNKNSEYRWRRKETYFKLTISITAKHFESIKLFLEGSEWRVVKRKKAKIIAIRRRRDQQNYWWPTLWSHAFLDEPWDLRQWKAYSPYWSCCQRYDALVEIGTAWRVSKRLYILQSFMGDWLKIGHFNVSESNATKSEKVASKS